MIANSILLWYSQSENLYLEFLSLLHFLGGRMIFIQKWFYCDISVRHSYLSSKRLEKLSSTRVWTVWCTSGDHMAVELICGFIMFMYVAGLDSLFYLKQIWEFQYNREYMMFLCRYKRSFHEYSGKNWINIKEFIAPSDKIYYIYRQLLFNEKSENNSLKTNLAPFLVKYI